MGAGRGKRESGGLLLSVSGYEAFQAQIRFDPRPPAFTGAVVAGH